MIYTYLTIGKGTYLGQLSLEDDNDIENAAYESIKSGAINVNYTAINYRAMKSEKSIGRTLLRLIKDHVIARNCVKLAINLKLRLYSHVL
jgi:hypothetical protein